MGYAISSRAARALTSLLRGEAKTSGSRYTPAAVSQDSFPPPFKVRWSAKESAWVMFLPTLSNVVYWGLSPLSSISGVTAAQDLPAGWYTLDNVAAAASAVYLIISVSSAGVATASIASAPPSPSPSSGEGEGESETSAATYSILVASLATDALKGKKTVKQYISSAVILGGGGGGSTVAGEGCYTLVESQGVVSFANTYYCVGNVLYSGPGGAATAFASKHVALKISAMNPASATLQDYYDFAAMAADSLDENYVVMPLYSLDANCQVLVDFRYLPRAQMVEIFGSSSS